MQEELNLERDWYELELASGASWNTQNFLEGTTLRLPIIDFRVDDCCSYPVLSVELCTELTLFLLHFTCRVLYQLHLFFSSKHLSYSNINTQYSLELFFLKSHLKRQIIIWLAETELN